MGAKYADTLASGLRSTGGYGGLCAGRALDEFSKAKNGVFGCVQVAGDGLCAVRSAFAGGRSSAGKHEGRGGIRGRPVWGKNGARVYWCSTGAPPNMSLAAGLQSRYTGFLFAYIARWGPQTKQDPHSI